MSNLIGALQRKMRGRKEARIKALNEAKAIVTDYLRTKGDSPISSISTILRNPELNSMISRGDIGGLRNRLLILKQAHETINRSASATEVESAVNIVKTCENVISFVNDFEKILKLLDMKSIKISSKDLFSIFTEFRDATVDTGLEKLVTPFYKKLLKKLKKDELTLERIVYELQKIFNVLPKEMIELSVDKIEEIQQAIVFRILEKFNIRCSTEEVSAKIQEMKERIELEEFERNFGTQKTAIKLGNFEHLTGREFEKYLEKFFSLKGYTVVKTPKSGDQGADLIISKNGIKTVVQAKKHSGKITNKAVQEVISAKNYYGADKCLVITNSSFTRSAVTLALRSGVTLWDGEKLKEEITKMPTESGKSMAKSELQELLKRLGVGVKKPECAEEKTEEKDEDEEEEGMEWEMDEEG
jgi:HJR/Mrr/RecB family endonuclease